MTTEPTQPAVLIDTLRTRANHALERWLPAVDREPVRLHEAMRYAVLNGGKRVRAVLVFAGGMAVGAPDERLDAPAAAVELIHAYSLVHDDMPVMDDDDLRRGKPSCHKAFDEATALLTGDALQSLAFWTLASQRDDASPRLAEMVEVLARASGSLGMAGGQAIDLAAVGHTLDLEALENMHVHKTGALIRASVRLGALSADGVDTRSLDALDAYAHCIGLAFQIRDDVLDVVSDTHTLGKQQGSDEAKAKPTYPALLGVEAARRKAHDLHERAIESLADFGFGADLLRWISSYIVTRCN